MFQDFIFPLALDRICQQLVVFVQFSLKQDFHLQVLQLHIDEGQSKKKMDLV